MSIDVTVRWISVLDEYPSPDATVLVALDSDADGERTWLGYSNGKEWFDACTGGNFVARVTHWAERPTGPNP